MSENTFGPRNDSEQLVFASEALLHDAQEMVAERMNELGWSRSQLAESAKVSDVDIDRFLSGDKPPTISTLGRLMRAMGCSVSIRSTRKPERCCAKDAVALYLEAMRNGAVKERPTVKSVTRYALSCGYTEVVGLVAGALIQAEFAGEVAKVMGESK